MAWSGVQVNEGMGIDSPRSASNKAEVRLRGDEGGVRAVSSGTFASSEGFGLLSAAPNQRRLRACTGEENVEVLHSHT